MLLDTIRSLVMVEGVMLDSRLGSVGCLCCSGDLGVEMPPEVVPITQKRIIDCCRNKGKPVVVATQMLESMIEVS